MYIHQVLFVKNRIRRSVHTPMRTMRSWLKVHMYVGYTSSSIQWSWLTVVSILLWLLYYLMKTIDRTESIKYDLITIFIAFYDHSALLMALYRQIGYMRLWTCLRVLDGWATYFCQNVFVLLSCFARLFSSTKSLMSDFLCSDFVRTFYLYFCLHEHVHIKCRCRISYPDWLMDSTMLCNPITVTSYP